MKLTEEQEQRDARFQETLDAYIQAFIDKSGERGILKAKKKLFKLVDTFINEAYDEGYSSGKLDAFGSWEIEKILAEAERRAVSGLFTKEEILLVRSILCAVTQSKDRMRISILQKLKELSQLKDNVMGKEK